MRPCGDWIELNGPRLTSTPHDQLGGRLDFSGAWMGMDGWTLLLPSLDREPSKATVNRIKMIKRQMYGRAKPDLPRKRVLIAD